MSSLCYRLSSTKRLSCSTKELICSFQGREVRETPPLEEEQSCRAVYTPVQEDDADDTMPLGGFDDDVGDKEVSMR